MKHEVHGFSTMHYILVHAYLIERKHTKHQMHGFSIMRVVHNREPVYKLSLLPGPERAAPDTRGSMTGSCEFTMDPSWIHVSPTWICNGSMVSLSDPRTMRLSDPSLMDPPPPPPPQSSRCGCAASCAETMYSLPPKQNASQPSRAFQAPPPPPVRKPGEP